MGLFSRPKSPDETCPRCGHAKSASLPVCTSCAMKQSAESAGGFPSERRSASAPPPAPVPPVPTMSVASPAWQRAPPPAPASGARTYDLHERNYPYRAKQGVWVRTPQELDCADFLFENGIAFAYEPMLDAHRPPFLLPEKNVVIDGATGWSAKERQAYFATKGFAVVALPEKDVKPSLRNALGPYFPGRAWKGLAGFA